MMHRLHALAILILAALVALPLSSAVVYHDYYGPYGGDTFLTWQQDYLLNNKSHATPPFYPQETFGGCYIATAENQVLQDSDCDKVPDIVDNCPFTPNPDQADQNNNGIGDACDLVVDKIVLDPSVVLEGRAFTATATLTNNRAYDLRNLKLTFQVPELGLEQTEYVDTIKTGQQVHYEFFLRTPNCAATKDYDLVLFVEWPKSPGVQESFHVAGKMGLKGSENCSALGPTDQGTSVINILDIQDVDPTLGGAYPFTIVNNEAESQAYVLSVDGTDDWGSYQIEPRSLIVVPAGESQTGVLTIFANPGATGEHGFSLTLRSKNDAKQVMLTARIKQLEPGMSGRAFVQLAIFVVGAIILVVAFAVAAQKLYEKRKEKEMKK
jgi:hypothetical protein